MQTAFSGLKRSVSIKALVIGALVLLLLIPVSMIQGVIHDRDDVHRQARHDIMRSWGNEQLIAGPVYVVPYTRTERTADGRYVERSARAYILPTRLDVSSDVDPEILYRGLHKVPTYRASMTISGEFTRPTANELGLDGAKIGWEQAYVVFGVSDARAIAENPLIEIGGRKTRFGPGGTPLIQNMPPPIVAETGNVFDRDDEKRATPFKLRIVVNGSDSLRFSPLGDTTSVSISSDWPSPSFVGNYLPAERSVADTGFTADWQVSSLGRALPSIWTSDAPRAFDIHSSSFGVNFYMPVSLYQTTLRASKYAVLFIGLSFVAYFLFEIMARLRLHPLQYLLVGFANALFYLLLLSLAEHTGFGWAYLLSTAASVGLVSGYSVATLGNRRRGYLMALILVLLYGFLYMTIKAETYALLAGSIGLWVALAMIMYLTRRIDWYAYGSAIKDDEASDPA